MLLMVTEEYKNNVYIDGQGGVTPPPSNEGLISGKSAKNELALMHETYVDLSRCNQVGPRHFQVVCMNDVTLDQSDLKRLLLCSYLTQSLTLLSFLQVLANVLSFLITFMFTLMQFFAFFQVILSRKFKILDLAGSTQSKARSNYL